MELGGAPTFKIKKIPIGPFEDLIGNLRVAIRYVLPLLPSRSSPPPSDSLLNKRYDTLKLTGTDVNVHWKGDGTFKFSGTYGK